MIKNIGVDLVISCWELRPDMSGLGLLKVVRADQEYSGVPFIMVVQSVTKNQVVEAGSAGVSDMMVRPFTKDSLAARGQSGHDRAGRSRNPGIPGPCTNRVSI